MTRERIEDFREIVLPFLSRTLLKTNYENMGKSDAEEFEKDFNEVLDLAIKALSQEPKTDDMTSSHSELDIYKGCIDLMNDLLRQVYEWLEIVGIDVSEMDEDEQFATHFYTTEIVERLFLWKTSHSGGTSQRMKLKELGITDDAVLFDFAKMIEPKECEG